MTVAAAAVLVAAVTSLADESVVTVRNGTLRGVVTASARAFRGVPFAAAPTGTRRWRPPQPSSGWAGVRNASAFGPGCEASEDCLTLNVFTPRASANPPGALLPVMLFVHGGCWKSGSSALYDGSDLVAFDRFVVVVTVNYRLSIFGFLGGSDVAAYSGDGSAGNFGIQDQRMAMRWVQENIAAFGGDRRRVMLFGQSVGAASVANHLVQPASWGLFSAAAMESGAFPPWACMTMGAADETLKQVYSRTNCSTVECLASLDYNTIRFQGYNSTAHCRWHTAWEPVVDGVELTDEVWVLARAGKTAPGVPVLMGTNANEGAIFTGVSPNASSQALSAWMATQWGASEVPAVSALYSEGFEDRVGFDREWWVADRESTDQGMFCPTMAAALWLAGQPESAPVFVYHFDHANGTAPYVAHGSEVPYVFHWPVLDAPSTRLSDKMATFWTNFAKSGDPNGPGAERGGALSAGKARGTGSLPLPRWPAFGDTAELLAFFGPDNITALEPGALDPANPTRCAFWDAFLQPGCAPLSNWTSGC